MTQAEKNGQHSVLCRMMGGWKLAQLTNFVNSNLGHIANLLLKRRWLVLLCSAGRRANVGQGIHSW